MTENNDHPAYQLESVPVPPDTLSIAARREWVTLSSTIYELKTARPADLRALELLCEILADITLLQETIRLDGCTVKAGSGGRKGHPALASLEKTRRQAHKLLGQFGLVPGVHTFKAPKFTTSQYNYGA